MDKRTNGLTNQPTHQRIDQPPNRGVRTRQNKHTNALWTDGQSEGPMDRCTNGTTDLPTNGLTNPGTNALWTDERTDGPTD